jgi:hypothetical protein
MGLRKRKEEAGAGVSSTPVGLHEVDGFLLVTLRALRGSA